MVPWTKSETQRASSSSVLPAGSDLEKGQGTLSAAAVPCQQVVFGWRVRRRDLAVAVHFQWVVPRTKDKAQRAISVEGSLVFDMEG